MDLKNFKMQKLTAADIPNGYNYAAVDSSGLAFAYKLKPYRFMYRNWQGISSADYPGTRACIGKNFDNSDWANSLVSITGEKFDPPKKLTFNDIPIQCNYAAINRYGDAIGYISRPVLWKNRWLPNLYEEIFKIGYDYDASNWTKSLICR